MKEHRISNTTLTNFTIALLSAFIYCNQTGQERKKKQ